jgi:hypothetical protein
MDDTNQIFQALGRIEGQLGGIDGRLESLSSTLITHIADDARLASRVMAVELDQARFSGAEATRSRRNAGLAGIIGSMAGAAAALLSRWSLGQH